MIAEVGNSQRTGYTAPKILHMVRHEPEAYTRASVLFLVHNYINWWLTGGPQGGVAVMEPGDTSGTALWHPGTGQWSRKVLDAIHPEVEGKLPPVRPSDRTIGALAPELAARFGLHSDCRIGAGCGDNMYGAVGTGNVEPGVVTVSLGTSGTAYTFLKEPFIDPTGEIAAFCDSTGHHLPLVCVSNLANGYDRLLAETGLSHAEFDALYEMAPPGCGGRVILPWYEGERTPDLPLAAPVSFGFGPEDHHPQLLCRAMVEGHVLNLFDGFSRLTVSSEEIRVTGGLSASRAWCQTLADVFGVEAVPVRGEGAALGAAIHAAWAWQKEEGLAPSLRELTRKFVVLDEENRRSPDPGSAPAYAILRRLFRALSLRLRGLDAEDPFSLRRELQEATGHKETFP
jgi:xylulokinase